MPITKHGYSQHPNKPSYQRTLARTQTLNNATHCGICGQPLTGPIEADHITPISQGGTHHPSNLRATHRTCNRKRGQG